MRPRSSLDMRLAKILGALFVVDCGNAHDAKKAEPSPPLSTFKCQKAADSFGIRTCVASGVRVAASTDAVFDATEAWCINERVSLANPRSRMRCVPTKDECEQRLASNQYARSPCTRMT